MPRKLLLTCSLVSLLFLQSCYVYTTQVGKGSQTGVETSAWNHYIFFGLAPVGVSNPKELAGDATDYSVTTKHSFVNGLCAGITFGIYTPTTTTVTK